MSRSTVKTAQVNPKKATKEVYLETEVNETPGYLTASQASKLQKQEWDSFSEAFQTAVPIEVATISLGQLNDAFVTTQDEFEQQECDERSIKKIVHSVVHGDSGLMKPVTVTEYDGVLYITGGRHRTKALAYIAEVMGLDEDSEVTVLYQTVEEYHQLVELIEADNAGRRMRGSELATIQSQLLGVTKDQSMEEALEHLFGQKGVTRSQLRKAVNSLVVRENRRSPNSPLTDEGAKTLVNYLTAELFTRAYDVTIYAKLLTAYYDYAVNNYSKLAKMVNAEFGDENVIRHGKFVSEHILEAIKVSKLLGKLPTQAEVKAAAKAEAEERREEKAREKAAKERAAIAAQAKADKEEQSKRRKAGAKPTKPAIVEVDDEEEEEEEEVVQPTKKMTSMTKKGKVAIQEPEELEEEEVELEEEVEVEEVVTRKPAARTARKLKAL